MITHSSTEVKLQIRERWLTSVLRISEGSAHENNNAGILALAMHIQVLYISLKVHDISTQRIKKQVFVTRFIQL